MRTDYFDDLLADVVTPVTPARKQGVTGGKREKPRNRADSGPLLHLLHPLHPETGSSGDDEAIQEHLEERAAIKEYEGGLSREDAEKEAESRIRVFTYRLAENPTSEQSLISPGSTLDEARRRLQRQFGERRVLSVKERDAGG